MKKGFTLIELLIVIVIIGILAGVTVGIINPTAQQNKAKDANVKAALNKIALATQGYISAYGSVPNDVSFIDSVTGATGITSADNSSCTGGGTDRICLFSLTGIDLPMACSATSPYNFTGASTDTAQCYFRYYGHRDSDTTNEDFGLYAKSWGLANTLFLYVNEDSTVPARTGKISHCSPTTSTGVGTCVQVD